MLLNRITAISPGSTWRDRVCLLTSWVFILFGCITVASWILQVPVWPKLSESLEPTIGTGACFGLIGAALLAWRQGTTASIRVGRAIGFLVTLLSAAFLIEHIADIDLGLDLRMLHAWYIDDNPAPGRTSVNMALSILLAGVPLWASDEDYISGRLRRTLAAALLARAGISALALFGRPDISDVYSSTIPIQFGSSVWYRLPIMHPAFTVLVGLLALNLSWIDSFKQPRRRATETLSSFRSSDFFFGVALMLLLTVAIGSYGSIKDLRTHFISANESHQLQMAFEELIINYHVARATWGGNIGIREPAPAALRDFDAAERAVEAQMRQLFAAVPQGSVDYLRLAEVKVLLQSDFSAMRETLQRKVQGGLRDTDSILATYREPRLHVDRVLQQIVSMRDATSVHVQQRRELALSSMQAAGTVLSLGSSAGFAVLCVAFAVLLRAQRHHARLEAGLRNANEELETRVTERTQAVLAANRQLETMNATLEQRVAERTTALAERTTDLEDFSYSVSHDLRAPLRAIDGYAVMLEEDHAGRLDTAGRDLLHKMRGQAKRMGELVDNLLRLSRFGRKALIESQIEMTHAVAEIWQEIRQDLRSREVAREPELRLDTLPAAHGDPDLLRQVWMNIIDNAVKFSGRVEHPVITIGATQNDRETVYFVRDNGAGFDMRYADKLFGVFQRLHDQSMFPGTGVGLAIASKIIRRHGGRIWAESTPGKGATFCFTLPRRAQ